MRSGRLRVVLAALTVAICVGSGGESALAAPGALRRIVVLGPAGTPVAGARLVPVATRVAGVAVFDPAAEVLATSDAAGRLSGWDVARVAGGLVVWLPGAAPALVPTGAAFVSVRLLPARPTRGRVREAGGSPAAKAQLVALPTGAGADLGQRTRTSIDGAYQLPGLHTGGWDLYLVRGHGRVQRIAHLDAGHTVGETRLHAATSLRGQVLDVDGGRDAVAAGVMLRFVAVGGDASFAAPGEVRTGPDGTFLAVDLTPGVYRVVLDDADWAFASTAPRVQVEAERARELEAWFALRRQPVSGAVVDLEGRAVAGAEIRLLVDPTRPWPAGAQAPATAAVRSDMHGRYRLPRVAPGRGYRLVATAPGRAPWVSDAFEVGRGRETKLELVHLRPGWRVLLRVRDDAGEPVAGALVTAVAARRPTAEEDAVWAAALRRGTTDASGHVDLGDLPDDDVLLRVSAAGFRPGQAIVDQPRVSDLREEDVTLHRGVPLAGRVVPGDEGPRPPFVVRARRRDGIGTLDAAVDAHGAFRFVNLADTATDLTVFRGTEVAGPPLARVENVLPGAAAYVEIPLPALRRVRGTVEEIAPGPTPVEVVLESQRYDPATERYVWRVAARAPVATDGMHGTFVLSAVPPGMYAARAVQGALDTGTVSVLVDVEDVDGIDLRMPAGARIAGSVLDAASKPVLGARITLTRWHGDDPSEIRAPGALLHVSDERGDFLFDGLAPGLWRVEAVDEERAPDVVYVRVADGEVRVTRDLLLTSGGALSGRVEDKDERPLDAVRVRVRRFDGDEAERVVRTDADGVFRATNLRPGTYHVQVVSPSVAGGPWIEAVADVEAERTTEVRFTAAADGSIEGTLRRRGRGVVGAVVDLVHDPDPGDAGAGAVRRYRTSTDVDGRFVVDRLDGGRYTIQVQSGAWRSEREVRLEAGDRLTVDLEAFEGRLRGTVITRDGDPVPGAFVHATPLREDGTPDAEAGFHAETRADPLGAFVLRGLPVGPYTLAVSAAGHPPGRLARVEVDLPGADFEVRVVLGRGGDIDLRVVDENDRGVTGARIWLEDEQGLALNRQAYVTGAAGRLRIEGVPPGTVRLRVRARGLGRPPLRTIHVEEGGLADVRIQVGPAGAIRLIVTGEGSDPLARARIDLVRAGTGDVLARRRPLSPIRLAPPWGFVPRTGVVTIPDLAAGDYVAIVSAGRTYGVAKVPIHVETGALRTVRVSLVPLDR